MFEKWRIKEHMEVCDSAGRHIGTVDETQDDRIKLTRSDSSDGSHHFVDWDTVDRIEDNRVYLKAGSPLPAGLETATTSAQAGGAGSAAANFGGSAGAANLPGEDQPLFGTSGHGTGMGGSGPT